ncbi:MAG: ABC transporter ATP-binding protein [Desulfovibrio sp.]|uniref:ABC transporter ATP-binding protein n=1 Tax=Desulfovibrio sp. 7SRBS1 TaxID=3378064 RepID=UPI003B3F329E
MFGRLRRKISDAETKAKQTRRQHADSHIYDHPLGADKVDAPQATGFSKALADVPRVRLEGISKFFGPVKANNDINLDIHAGRILALLGENGAGKSTLMSILAGRYQPDAGTIYINGYARRFTSSKDAIAAGIGMVYQHFMLVNTMTVAQNVLLGQEEGFWVRPDQQESHVAALAARYGLEIDPSAIISDLSMGQRQRVEILKLLHRNSEVLIFDEPTAVLTPPEIVVFFEALKTMAEMGKAIVFISHKLEEVLGITDDIAVLRQGHIVDTLKPTDVADKSELANRMVGREVVLEVNRRPAPIGDVVMEIKDVTSEGLHDINLNLRQGEVVAIVGVAGNGQKELVRAVTGHEPPRYGSINLLGKSWKDFYADVSWKDTLSYIPEDRLGLATCPELDMVDNVLLTTRQGFSRAGLMQNKRARKVTGDLIKNFNVRPGDAKVPAGKLSGGNLQKLVIAREFFRCPRIIVAEQPTQGLDISATEEVWRQLLAARETAGILLVTGDLSEALQLADRVAVMYRGRFMDVVPTSDEKRVDRIGLLMAGVADKQ